MNLGSDTLSAAYLVYSEWGPDRRTPRPKRLRNAFPLLTEADVDSLMSLFKQVDAAVWELAEKGGDAKLGREAVRDSLKTDFPFLAGPGLDRAHFLVNYYAWHEGYST